MEAQCSNCDAIHITKFRYCPDCGQSTVLHRLTFHDIVHEAIHYFTHADKGIFQLVKALAVKRGLVAKEYVLGRRKKYFPPLNFLLLIAAIFVFMATLSHGSDAPPASETVAADQMQIYSDRTKIVNFYVTKYSNIMALLSLPLTSFFFWLFYRKRGHNFIEHLVAGMYMLGFTLIVYTFVLLPLENIFDIQRNAVKITFLFFQLWYFTAFYSSFIITGNKNFSARAFSASLTGMLLWVIVTSAVFQIYILTGFWGLAA